MYKCSYCNKTFSTEVGKNKHQQHYCKSNPNRIKIIIPTRVCDKCSANISTNQFNKHYTVCTGQYTKQQVSYHVDHEDLFCKFCGKECKSKNSLAQHEIRCKDNPERINFATKEDCLCQYCNKQLSTLHGKQVHEVYCEFNPNKKLHAYKGQTIRTNDSLLKGYKKRQEKYQSGELVPSFKNKHHTEETKDRLRATALEQHYEKHFGHHKTYIYDGIDFYSSYEYVVAMSLDQNSVIWEKPQYGVLNYCDNSGKTHKYTPDFYLPEYNVYLDPKNDFLIENINPVMGYRDIDKIHWVMEQNNVKVIILNKDQLDWQIIKTLI